MALSLCIEAAAADWLAASSLPWQQLVTFGPAGFECYARLRFLADPAFNGQAEADVERGAGPSDGDLLRRALTLLAGHTLTPQECYFCLWDGFGDLFGGGTDLADDDLLTPTGPPLPDARPGLAPHPTPAMQVVAPTVVVPHRAYWLFRGPLTEAGDWGAASPWPDCDAAQMPAPAFAWPADRAWCVANDVDPHWAGIGAGRRAIEALIADPQLDVVLADPAGPQPAYA